MCYFSVFFEDILRGGRTRVSLTIIYLAVWSCRISQNALGRVQFSLQDSSHSVISKCGPQTSRSSIWEIARNTNFGGPNPELRIQKLRERNPGVCVFTSLPSGAKCMLKFLNLVIVFWQNKETGRAYSKICSIFLNIKKKKKSKVR